jgi:hypothetical protein
MSNDMTIQAPPDVELTVRGSSNATPNGDDRTYITTLVRTPREAGYPALNPRSRVDRRRTITTLRAVEDLSGEPIGMGAHCREDGPTGTVALASVMGSRSRCVRAAPLILDRRGGCMPGARRLGRGIPVVE